MKEDITINRNQTSPCYNDSSDTKLLATSSVYVKEQIRYAIYGTDLVHVSWNKLSMEGGGGGVCVGGGGGPHVAWRLQEIYIVISSCRF